MFFSTNKINKSEKKKVLNLGYLLVFFFWGSTVPVFRAIVGPADRGKGNILD